LVTELGASALFLTIYIAEAHAEDQWPLGNHVNIKQHQTLQDRLQAASNYQAMLSKKGLSVGEIVVDSMDNRMVDLFACHPERFFIIHQNKLVYKAQPVQALYHVSHLRKALLSLVG